VRSGGGAEVFSGGTADGTSVSAGGTLEVFASGVDSGTLVSGTVAAPGVEIVAGGVADSATAGSDGEQIVSSGGVTSGATVGLGGDQIVSSSGVARDTTLSGGRDQIVSSGGAGIALPGGGTISNTDRVTGGRGGNGGSDLGGYHSPGGTGSIFPVAATGGGALETTVDQALIRGLVTGFRVCVSGLSAC
jgi:autotransporter passenger strand-loop-strand repeat protein